MARTNRIYQTYEGKPCPYGHRIRFISSNNCVECQRRSGKEFRQRQGMKPAHGYTKDGWRPHYLYRTWQKMIQRCENPNHQEYKNYGARGIKVCDRWRYSFETFLNDILSTIGERPNGHTLDRIDNDRHYQLDNLRWASRRDQARNRRPPFVKLTLENARWIRILYAAKLMNIKELAQEFAVSPPTIGSVIKNKTWQE